MILILYLSFPDVFNCIRYMRGDMKNEEEISFLQSTVGHGLDREELRDEIYAQCMRQATGNPSADMCEKVIFCLHSFHCQKQKRYI